MSRTLEILLVEDNANDANNYIMKPVEFARVMLDLLGRATDGNQNHEQ